jgi:AcrR family transcriptional regulator
MSAERRPYRMKRRAELEAQTRLRITEATVELHGTVGPARTTVSAIAEKAGVRRSTVYRHFADEDALFEACSAHWSAEHPAPDIGTWAAVEDPADRLDLALRELYAFYRGGEQMLANLIRDEHAVASVRRTFGPFRGYLEAAAGILAEGRPARGAAGRRLEAALGHALAFTTWRSLACDQGLGDRQAAELMRRLVDAAV